MTLSENLNHFIFQRRFSLLFSSLLFLFVIAALGQYSFWEDELFLADMCLIVAASLYAVERITHHFALFTIVGIVVMISNGVGYFIPGQEADLLASSFSLVFLMAVIMMLFRHIFSKHTVNFNTIIGAVCLFMLIGITFGFAYQLTDYFVPSSFHYASEISGTGTDAFLDRFFYYSFTTITTLGYGDIIPLSPPARYLSTFEALTGQLYLTILLARLVGLHLSQRQD